jgi:hypothetical protein
VFFTTFINALTFITAFIFFVAFGACVIYHKWLPFRILSAVIAVVMMAVLFALPSTWGQ